MKKLSYLLVFTLGFTLFSCVNEDDFIEDNHYYNSGEVYFDGFHFPLNYADMYYLNTYNDRAERWALILSENYIRSGSTYTDAYIYMEFIRPYGSSLATNYYINDPIRPILFSVYMEGVELYNGDVEHSDVIIPNGDFTSGQLNIRLYNHNINRFDIQLRTYDGYYLDAYFEGLLRY